jgi:CPA2 family monovalent cation:H+ antiporter-2
VHPEVGVLRELIVLAGVSLAVVLLFQRLRLPALVGFIATGVLIGPGGLGLVGDPALVQTLAEIGVVVLLFTVGLEFSLADLRAMGRRTVVAGALQIAFTLAAVAALLTLAGVRLPQALFVGMMVALSSTAVVLKLLSDRAELASPHGRLSTGVLLFQDIMVIPFVLLTPLLGRWSRGAGGAALPGHPEVLGGLAAVAGVVLMLFAARRVIPWVLGRASRTGSKEAFLFGVMLVVLGSAALADLAGVSLALGAFVAGLLLAESDLRTQIAAAVLPFRDVLGSVFFIAIGMSFDPAALARDPLPGFAAAAVAIGVKGLVTLAALRLAGVPWRVAAAASLALAQVGEFSFVLAKAGTPLGLLDGAWSQAFYVGAVISLLLSPLLIARAPRWSLGLDLWLGDRLGGRAPTAPSSAEEGPARSDLRHDHVVIAGFGLNGRNVARVLRATRLAHVVVDLQPDHLQVAATDGSPTLLGDVTREAVQRAAGVPRARVLVLALSDPGATRQALRIARSLSHDLFVVVRTRYVVEIDQLYADGADQVIPEEFETSIEIFTAVLREFHVPPNVVNAQIALLRQERYSLLRGRRLPGNVVEQLDAILQAGTTDTFLLLQHSPAVGRSLGELGLCEGRDARVVAVVRGTQAMTDLPPGLVLRVGDTLVLTGTHADMDRAFARLSPPDAVEGSG